MRRLKHAAASEREQRVAAEGNCLFIEMVGDMAQSMPWGFDDLRFKRSDAGLVPLLHLAIKERNARHILGRTPHFRVWKFCLDVRDALDVIGVMVGDQYIGQIPASLRQSRESGPCFRDVDAGGRPVAGSCTRAP